MNLRKNVRLLHWLNNLFQGRNNNKIPDNSFKLASCDLIKNIFNNIFPFPYTKLTSIKHLHSLN